MNRQQYLQTAEKTICRDRQDVHGNPESTHDLIAEYWSTYLSEECKIHLELSASDVAIMMTLFKIARMQVNPKHQDNIVDGIGYLAIAGEIIDSVEGSDELLNQR
jgi:hypothetical protein